MPPEAFTRSVLLRWLKERRRFVWALLVDADGSSPLDPGAMMLIADNLELEGTLTGGCVEGALVEEARQVLAGAPPHLSSFGFSDELAGQVGLMCGGNVTVLLSEPSERDAATLVATLTAIESGRPTALAVKVDEPDAGSCLALIGTSLVGSLGDNQVLSASVARDLPGMLELGHAKLRRYGLDGTQLGDGAGVFIQSFLQPPRLIIFGATDFSASTASLAHELGYTVTICDPRKPFAASERYSSVATVVEQWPDVYLNGLSLGPRDAVLVFTHDPKFDEPAVRAAVATDVGYIGALGSRRTAAERERRLRAAGLTEGQLARVISPCGHDIGAGTPAETALSILAEIIAQRHHRSGGSLSGASGPIRARAEDVPATRSLKRSAANAQATAE